MVLVKKYNWNKYKMMAHRNSMIEYLETHKFSREKEDYIAYEISVLSELLKIDDKYNCEYYDMYVDQLSHILKSNYDLFKSLNPEIKSIISDVMVQLKGIYVPEDTTMTYEEHDFSESLEISRDFYSSLMDGKLLKEFERYVKYGNRLIKYSSNGMSYTYPFFYPKYIPYIIITEGALIEEVENINHEVAHAIYLSKDSYTTYNNDLFYLWELEGNLFNYLTSKYLDNSHIGSESDLISLYKESIYAIFDTLISLAVSTLALSSYDEKTHLYDSNILFRLGEMDIEIGDGPLIIPSCLKESLRINIMNLISFLTSLDLQVIDESDPEYAFHLFESIRNNKSDSLFTNLRKNHITFMDDGCKNLRKELEKFSLL